MKSREARTREYQAIDAVAGIRRAGSDRSGMTGILDAIGLLVVEAAKQNDLLASLYELQREQ